MKIKDFKLKWADGMCRGQPTYVSNKKLLIPSNFFAKTFDFYEDHVRYHFETKFKIGCCSSIPELGIVAISERKTNGAIHILSYPKMSEISLLEQNNNESYSALQFMGLEFLISLQIKQSYEIDLWKWYSGERVYFLSVASLISEILHTDVNLFPNPLLWHQCLFQSNARLTLLEIKYSDDKYTLQSSSYFFFIDKEGSIDLSIKNEFNDQRDFQNDIINPLLKSLRIQSVCWLPENNILVATYEGFFKIEYSNSTLHKLADNKNGVCCMTLSKSGLFIGNKTGYIDIVNIIGYRWHLLETIKVDQPINHLILSPDFNYLTMTSLKGSVFYLQICKSESTFKVLHRAEFGGEVGVGFIGPFAKLGATAMKNGLIHIFRTIDGRMLSTFRLDEEIISLAASPLCSCVVIGTNGGFIYFIDATDAHKPKVVHCEKPYDIPVQHLKFDNFGRYLFASAQNQPIKIWNGLPSSGFALLGLKKVTNQVKDLCAFSRSEDDETILLVLSESGSGSENEAGNILIRLKLPLDFGSDPKKYQIDVFGTLSGDALNFQKRKLDSLCCKMDVHWNLGAIFYSPTANKIHKYSIWTDFTNVKHDNILTIKNVNYIRISPNQHWIGVTDLYGCVYLYSSKELVLSAESEKYCALENICKSYIEFPLSSNFLICGRENGITLCYEWTDDSNILQNVPEWVVNCCSHSAKEDEHLHSTEEEGLLDIISQSSDQRCKKSIFLSGIYEELLVGIRILNFKLNAILDVKDTNFVLSSSIFVFNDDMLENVCLHNRKKLLLIMSENASERIARKSGKQNVVKTVSSVNSGFVIQNYSRESIDNDINRVHKLNSHVDKKVALRKSLPNFSFTKRVKMKCKEERLTSIIDLFNQICDLKNEFNEEFENLSKVKPHIDDRLDKAYLEAKLLAKTLPSKAERDLWSASVVERDLESHLETIMFPNLSNEHVMSNKSSNNVIKETKSSIESHVKSARSVQEDFDFDVENLSLKKRYYDYKIYKFEVKIYCILFFTEEEDNYTNWREETEKEIKLTEDLLTDLDKLRKEVSDVEKNVKDTYSVCQKMERHTSGKIDSKCKKINITNEVLTGLKKQPILKLDDKSHNPFWHSCPRINTEDIKSISKEALFEDLHSNEEHRKDWDSICNKQIRVLKIGIILRNLQTQLLTIQDIKHSLDDANSELELSKEILQNSMKYMSLLISKSSMAFYNLVTAQLENEDLKTEGEPKSRKEHLDLSNNPGPDHKIWKTIDRETCRIMHIHQLLGEIENIFDHHNKLKSDILTISSNIRLEYIDTRKIVKDKLEESKQNVLKTRNVADENLEDKKNLLKALKQHLSDIGIQEKIYK